MIKAFINIWRIKELRTKLAFTFGMLAIYRIGFFIPLPGVNQTEIQQWAQNLQGSGEGGNTAGNVLQFMSIFTGGSLGQSTVFGLGIMPYISAAIIFQLLATVLPSLQALRKEGAAGQQKITEWTRYATVGLCLVQAMFWVGFMQGSNLVYPEYSGTVTFWLCGVLGLTAGTVFLMWLGEQIDKHGIGNGISLIITAGILAQMDNAIGLVISDFSMAGDGAAKYGPMTVIFLIASFVLVVAGSIIITQGQRRIPIQQAKHTRGRRVYGGQKSYLPLRVNHGGVMPIIFASALMMFPSLVVTGMDSIWKDSAFVSFLQRNLQMGEYIYILIYVGLIYFFAYFWTTVQFQPKEMATNLRDHGSFIPGLRPGPRTADYLETVMERITYVGAGFLAVIAVIPAVIARFAGIPFLVSSFLGGTGLLITVSVVLDFVQRIEANLHMRNYEGFLGSGGKIRGGRDV